MIGEQYALGARRRGEQARAQTLGRAGARAAVRRERAASVARSSSSVRVGPRGDLSHELSQTAARERFAPLAARRSRQPLDLLQDLGRSVLVRLLLAMSFAALAALLYLLQASQASVLSVNISDLRAAHTQLAAENTSLRITAASMQSLPRIDDAATRQLQMLKPDLSTAIWISPILPRVENSPSETVGRDSSDGPIWMSQMTSAQRASQPLDWMRRALGFVLSSL